MEESKQSVIGSSEVGKQVTNQSNDRVIKEYKPTRKKERESCWFEKMRELE